MNSSYSSSPFDEILEGTNFATTSDMLIAYDLGKVYTCLVFDSFRSLTTYKILPEVREEKLISKVERRLETVNNMTLLETFRPAYEAFCDFYDINPDPSVVWVITF